MTEEVIFEKDGKTYKEEVRNVWWLVQKSDGWVALESSSEDELPRQRGFEIVEPCGR